MTNIQNFKKLLIARIQREKDTEADIEAFVFDSAYVEDEWTLHQQDVPAALENVPLNWEQYSHLLDYEFDNSHGDRGCHLVRIYTKDNIYYLEDYDGMISVRSLPRNPS